MLTNSPGSLANQIKKMEIIFSTTNKYILIYEGHIGLLLAYWSQLYPVIFNQYHLLQYILLTRVNAQSQTYHRLQYDLLQYSPLVSFAVSEYSQILTWKSNKACLGEGEKLDCPHLFTTKSPHSHITKVSHSTHSGGGELLVVLVKIRS